MIRGDDVMIHYSVFSTPCRRAPADAAQSRRVEGRETIDSSSGLLDYPRPPASLCVVLYVQLWALCWYRRRTLSLRLSLRTRSVLAGVFHLTAWGLSVLHVSACCLVVLVPVRGRFCTFV